MGTETVIAREAEFLEKARQNLLTSAEKLTVDHPVTLPKQLLAPFPTATQQAFETAQSGVGAYQPYLTQAGTQMGAVAPQYASGEGILSGLAGRGSAGLDEARAAALVGAGDITGRISAFQDPYQQQVMDAFNLEAERQGGVARQRAADAALRAGAFGGSRAGVQSAELERALADVKQRNTAGLLSQGYGQALGAAEREAGRLQQLPGQLSGIEQLQYQLPSSVAQNQLQAGQARMGLAQGYGGLGGLAQQMPAADIALLSQVGGQQQQQAQRTLDLARQNQLAQTYEPYQRIGWMGDILKGIPSVQSTLTQSTDPRSNPLSTALGAGISLAGIFGSGGFGTGYLFNNPYLQGRTQGTQS